MKRQVRELVKAMEKITGEDAEISIFHKLYGDQKLRSLFSPIINEKIGFNIKGQEIYINKDEIEKISLENDICFADDVMEIQIKLNRQ